MKKVLLITLAIIFWLTSSAFIGQAEMVFNGWIGDHFNEDIANVIVYLTNPVTNETYSTYTNKYGNWKISFLVPGIGFEGKYLDRAVNWKITYQYAGYTFESSKISEAIVTTPSLLIMRYTFDVYAYAKSNTITVDAEFYIKDLDGQALDGVEVQFLDEDDSILEILRTYKGYASTVQIVKRDTTFSCLAKKQGWSYSYKKRTGEWVSANHYSWIVDYTGYYAIEGRVLDDDYKALPTVKVTALNKLQTQVSSVYTNSEGYYKIPAGEAYGLSGLITLNFSKDGYLFNRNSVKVTEPQSVDVTAKKIYTFNGFVQDSTGKGIQDVRVSTGSIVEYSSASGAFSIKDLSGDNYIALNKTGYEIEPSSLKVDKNTGTKTFLATYSISGKVQNTSGVGIGGVKLLVGGEPITTDGYGRYQVNKISGTCTVQPVATEGFSFAPSSRLITSPTTTADFTIDDAQYELTGKVVDEASNPIQDVSIVTDNGKTTLTDINGEYRIIGIKGNAIVTPKKDGYAFAPSNLTSNFTSKTANFTASYSISGYVKDELGNSIQGVIFTVAGKKYSTTIDGYFKIDGISGSHVIAPTFAEGYTFKPNKVTISKPDDRLSFTVTYAINGYVTDGNGVGIPDIEVLANNASTVTDAKGLFYFDGLSGQVTLSARKAGYGFAPSKRVVTGPTADIRFMPSYSVSGYIKDLDGLGIELVSIKLGDAVATTTKKDGYFQVNDISNDVRLIIEKTGYEFIPNTIVINKPSSQISVTGTYEISGNARDEDGNGYEDVQVRVRESVIKTDKNGNFTVKGLSGLEKISFNKDKHLIEPSSIEVSGPADRISIKVTPPPPPVVYSTSNVRLIERITNDEQPKSFPRVSPSGALIVFSVAEIKSNGEFIWSLQVKKTDASPAVIDTSAGNHSSQATWFPDGERMLFINSTLRSKPIMVIQSYKGGAQSFVTPNPIADYDQYPDLNKSGTKIVFSSIMRDKNYIFTINLQGTEQWRLMEGNQPRWNPIDDSIVFIQKTGENYQIAVYKQTGELMTLTRGTSDCFFPSWSPDGQWITFISNMDGKYHLYLMKSDGTSVTQLTSGLAETFYSEWGPDGKIYFASDAGSPVPKTKNPLNWRYSNIWRLAPILPNY